MTAVSAPHNQRPLELPSADISLRLSGTVGSSERSTWRGIGWVSAAFVRLAGERPDDSGIFYLLSNQARNRWLVTGLEYIFGALDEAGAFRPAVLRWDLYGIRGADVTTVRDRDVIASQGVIPSHYNNMIKLDTQVDIGVIGASEAADQLWRLLELLSGADHH